MLTLTDHEIASSLASSAGEVLLQVRGQQFADLTARKAAGDAEAHRYLAEQLRRLRPADAVLSEEGADDLVRLDRERVWIVDPLDGTREFAELERAD